MDCVAPYPQITGGTARILSTPLGYCQCVFVVLLSWCCPALSVCSELLMIAGTLYEKLLSFLFRPNSPENWWELMQTNAAVGYPEFTLSGLTRRYP
uniref:Secreted protein n=1 Tax=Loa loa TaxID=7209 RepID=A0A1I7V5D1_LOALO